MRDNHSPAGTNADVSIVGIELQSPIEPGHADGPVVGPDIEVARRRHPDVETHDAVRRQSHRAEKPILDEAGPGVLDRELDAIARLLHLDGKLSGGLLRLGVVLRLVDFLDRSHDDVRSLMCRDGNRPIDTSDVNRRPSGHAERSGGDLDLFLARPGRTSSQQSDHHDRRYEALHTRPVRSVFTPHMTRVSREGSPAARTVSLRPAEAPASC